MNGNRSVLTFLTILILCLAMHNVFADYKSNGSVTSGGKNEATDNNLHVVSRVGFPIVGNTGNASVNIHSGINDFFPVMDINETSQSSSSPVPGADMTKMPTEFKLLDNYPNPFNPRTTIRFEIPIRTTVTLRIYDIHGRDIAVLLRDRAYEAGRYEVNFDASHLSSGIYLYQFSAGTHNDVRKMILLK